MPAHLFQEFQLVIGLSICPFAPPSLETTISDWLRKRWSRLDFNPRMNHSHIGEEPERRYSGFVYNGFGFYFAHWLRWQSFSPVLVTQEEGGGSLRGFLC